MKPHNDPLRRLKIVSPCTEDWDAMTGNDAVRFCSHCSRDVHNIATITRSEALDLVRSSKGRLCAQIVRRPDGSIQTSDALPFFDFIVRAPRAAAGVLSVALAATPVFAQSGDGKTCDTPVAVQNEGGVSDVPGPNEEVTVETYTTGGIIAMVSAGEQMLEHAEDREAFDKLHPESADAAQPPIFDVLYSESTRKLRAAIRGSMDIAARGHYGETALMAAARSYKMVNTLVEAGAAVNATNEFGVSALMVAAVHGNAKTVKYLIDHGAYVNARDNKGRSALMMAAADRRDDVIQVLVNAGADRFAVDADGLTAKDYYGEQ